MENTPDAQPTIEELIAGFEERAKSISVSTGRRVFAIVLPDAEKAGEFVVGFAYEPDLQTQLRLMDKGQAAGVNISIEACSTALETLILKSETDPRILDQTGTAMYWKGACFALSEFLLMAVPVFKKK